MATAKLKCDACGSMKMVTTGRQGWRSVLDAGYKLGWKMRNGEWFCCDECIARTAKDITPMTKKIELRK